MILRQSTVTFGVLAAAFAISALYRATLMEIPEYDAFTPTTGAAYLAFVGISALVLTDRHRAWWVVSTLVIFLLSMDRVWIEKGPSSGGRSRICICESKARRATVSPPRGSEEEYSASSAARHHCQLACSDC